MTEPKFVHSELDGSTLIITPLFTHATFKEPGIADEWAMVQRQIDATSTKNVVIDLGEIPYLGSTVLEWMSQIWKRVKMKNGRLAAIRPSTIGREVLAAARLDRLWGIFEDRQVAQSWFMATENPVGSH